MTIVNRSHGFVFIHVPKTAGTSIKLHMKKFQSAGDFCLLDSTGGQASSDRENPFEWNLRKHSRAVEVAAHVGGEEFSGFFKFSCVRNPFDRTRSTFRFLKFKFRNWPRSDIMDRFKTLEQFVTSDFFRQSGPGRIFEPQIWWLTSDEGTMSMDFLARLESLDEDIARVLLRLSLEIPVTPVERKNVNAPDDSNQSALLTPEAVEAIHARYRCDFETLGYPPQPPDGVRS